MRFAVKFAAGNLSEKATIALFRRQEVPAHLINFVFIDEADIDFVRTGSHKTGKWQ